MRLALRTKGQGHTVMKTTTDACMLLYYSHWLPAAAADSF